MALGHVTMTMDWNEDLDPDWDGSAGESFARTLWGTCMFISGLLAFFMVEYCLDAQYKTRGRNAKCDATPLCEKLGSRTWFVGYFWISLVVACLIAVGIALSIDHVLNFALPWCAHTYIYT